jgi:hypothetical protein
VNFAGDSEHQPGKHVGAGGAYDPWSVLGLKAGASADDIRLRYHDLMREVHPQFAEDGKGDLERWAEVDRAYRLITQAPALDKRYRNLTSDAQRSYYRVLPDWMARNVDDRPSWYTYARYKMPPTGFIMFAMIISYIAGRLIVMYPYAAPIIAIAVLGDFLFHVSLTPIVLALVILRAWTTNPKGDISWLMSPKNFLQKELTY